MRIWFLFLCFSLGAQEKPVQLYKGMGVYHHPIQTRNPEAQKFFDQGLVLLYGFNRYEAFRSFQKAAELDPQAPMPYFGMAAAQAPHINMDLDGDVDLKKGCGYAREAVKRAGGASKYEMDYAQAAAAMCDGEARYHAALRRLHETYPDDPDAATFYAESMMVPVRWRWFTKLNGEPAGEMAKCIDLLERLLRRDPDHPGANHFYVHAVEMSKNPERALPSAQRLMGGIAPNAGHLVHMAGHIYMRVGDYEVVASSNERAIQVDEEYFHHSGVHGGYMGYYAHNLHFLTAARMMQGRFEEALAAANKMLHAMHPFVTEAPQVADAFVVTPLLVLARFHKWDEVLQYAKPEGRIPISQSLWHYARALASLAKGDRAAATKEQTAFEKMRAALPADAIFLNNKGSDILLLASEVLKAKMASSDSASLPHWTRAVDVQDRLVYDEPPPWYFPVREGLGAAQFRMGRYADAEKVFRDELERTPRSGRLLYGLHQAILKQGREADAMWVKAEFDRASRKALVPLRPEGF
jgi:tetratricopeptide (TPR) repeat protein